MIKPRYHRLCVALFFPPQSPLPLRHPLDHRPSIIYFPDSRMSVSLLSRQLHGLRLGQRAVAVGASWLAPALRSGSRPVVVAPISVSQHYSFDLVASRTFSIDANIHEQPSLDKVNYYSTNNNKNIDDDDDDDDGGPVTSSAATATINNLQSMSIKELSDMSTIPGWNLVHNPPRKNPRGALVGRVVSDKMQKTVNVAVDRYKIIPKYRKRWRFTKKFMAHDEHEVCNIGDLVMIVPCQKISRHKHFMVREIIRPKGLL
jgi:small subunit ribosomal protein S17